MTALRFSAAIRMIKCIRTGSGLKKWCYFMMRTIPEPMARAQPCRPGENFNPPVKRNNHKYRNGALYRISSSQQMEHKRKTPELFEQMVKALSI